ncbi:40754_t:CDS:1 [Gigaspora margarita]|uniref:40754_t:CDS:1 n=1 Tax=Gigaspora margarita TaxID=4874 RepID=A0ABN7UM11_GIGMA|nr:40754_t:CDS:1 [Gigaspora margarita]
MDSFDKKKISFGITNDKKYYWYYLKIFYNNKPCSLKEFELYSYENTDYNYKNMKYKYSKINNKDGTESFLFQRNAKLYFKNILLFEFIYNEYQIKELSSNNDNIYIYLTLNNKIVNLNKEFVYKFINDKDYSKIENKKNINFNNNLFEIIEKTVINNRVVYELKKNRVGWYYFFFHNIVIKHIRTEYVFDFYNKKDNNYFVRFFTIAI